MWHIGSACFPPLPPQRSLPPSPAQARKRGQRAQAQALWTLWMRWTAAAWRCLPRSWQPGRMRGQLSACATALSRVGGGGRVRVGSPCTGSGRRPESEGCFRLFRLCMPSCPSFLRRGAPIPTSISLAAHAGDWGEGEARAAARPGEEDEEGGGEEDGEVYGDFEDLETGALSCACLAEECCAFLSLCCAALRHAVPGPAQVHRPRLQLASCHIPLHPGHTPRRRAV